MANYDDPKCIGCPYCYADHLRDTSFKNKQTKPLAMEQAVIPLGVLVVGQAPGENEWRECRPFFFAQDCSSTAGRRLKLSWDRVNEKYNYYLHRGSYNISNTVQCFPGRYRATTKNKSPRDKRPRVKALANCLEWLKHDILTVRPRLIICFGKIAETQIDIALQALLEAGQILTKPRVENLPHPSGPLSNDDLDAVWCIFPNPLNHR